jgi:hypothetical protein
VRAGAAPRLLKIRNAQAGVEGRFVRRLLVSCLIVLFALPLAVRAADLLPEPVVIVYPFTLNGNSLDKSASSRLAIIIANQIAAAGGMHVQPPTLGVERKDYLTVARKASADYYISGFISPLGDDVTVVEQVVSTVTGVVIYSNTAQLKTYADAAGQGDLIAAAIIRHNRRNLDAYAAPPPPPPSPTPEAAGGPEANIGKLFGRKKQATKVTPSPQPSGAPAVAQATLAPSTPAPAATRAPASRGRSTPTPTPAPVLTPTPPPVAVASPVTVAVAAPPRSGYAVLAVGGTADADRRDYAAQRILAFVQQSGAQASAAAFDAANVKANARDICAAANAAQIVVPALAAHSETVFGQTQTTASIDLTAYSCDGKLVYHKTFDRDAGGDWKVAVDRAISAAFGAFLNPPKPKR